MVTRSSAIQPGVDQVEVVDSTRNTSTVLGDQVIGNARRTGGDHQVEVFVGAIREPSSDQVDDDEICLAY